MYPYSGVSLGIVDKQTGQEFYLYFTRNTDGNPCLFDVHGSVELELLTRMVQVVNNLPNNPANDQLECSHFKINILVAPEPNDELIRPSLETPKNLFKDKPD